MKYQYLIILIVFIFSCNTTEKNVGGRNTKDSKILPIRETSLIILGTIQDGGSPHIGCNKNCCKDLFQHPELHKNVVSIGIVDPLNHKKYIIECTPDFTVQAKQLQLQSGFNNQEMPDAIFLTHAHIGHYSGLMYLGKEAINSDTIAVFAMPRMIQFLKNNGPWSQLVNNKNIALHSLTNNLGVQLTSNVVITPIIVPHRDEYSETVGFIIEGPNKKVLFIPDIDKWEKWDKDITQLIEKVDIALIDGTFYSGEEINNRNIASIPHPFIIESMELFKGMSLSTKNKIHFIHFNHTNPVLDTKSAPSKNVKANGYKIAESNEVFRL